MKKLADVLKISDLRQAVHKFNVVNSLCLNTNVFEAIENYFKITAHLGKNPGLTVSSVTELT